MRSDTGRGGIVFYWWGIGLEYWGAESTRPRQGRGMLPRVLGLRGRREMGWICKTK